MKKIFVDCSYLNEHPELNTGIQRVVRRVIENLGEISKDNNFQVVPINISNGQFKKVNIEELYLKKAPIVNESLNVVEIIKEPTISIKKRVFEYLKEIYHSTKNLFIAIFPFPFLKKFILVNKDSFGLDYLLYGVTIKPLRYILNAPARKKEQKEFLLRQQELLSKEKELEVNRDDILLLLDSTWYLNIWGSVQKCKNNGAHIIAVIYDIIPISHPMFCDDFLAQVFKDWFYESTKYIDGFITISDTVKIGLKEFLIQELGEKVKNKKFDFFHLGSDFKYNFVEEKDVREDLKGFLSKRSTYLIVSTVEPRKNHKYLLDVFDELWQSGIDINLCIIGRTGWKVDELMNRITSHKEFGNRLFYGNNVNDKELLYSYENSKMLLFPSIIEGFGLPIVESLLHKLPVLASDTPIHREVGGDKIGYFDISDINDLKNRIIDIEKNGIPQNLVVDKNYKWLSWRDSTEMLLDKINKVTA